jgi:4-hydroxyphenylacetate 3-monooxygenase
LSGLATARSPAPARPSPCRIRLMRLAWDVIGAQFARRHQQYEKFYCGASEVVKGDLYRFRARLATVDRALGLPAAG